MGVPSTLGRYCRCCLYFVSSLVNNFPTKTVFSSQNLPGWKTRVFPPTCCCERLYLVRCALRADLKSGGSCEKCQREVLSQVRVTRSANKKRWARCELREAPTRSAEPGASCVKRQREAIRQVRAARSANEKRSDRCELREAPTRSDQPGASCEKRQSQVRAVN